MQATNHQITPTTWENLYTREGLRAIAKAYGIRRGRSKTETAINLALGYCTRTEAPCDRVTFYVYFNVSDLYVDKYRIKHPPRQ